MKHECSVWRIPVMKHECSVWRIPVMKHECSVWRADSLTLKTTSNVPNIYVVYKCTYGVVLRWQVVEWSKALLLKYGDAASSPFQCD